jgi:hypothetical protein
MGRCSVIGLFAPLTSCNQISGATGEFQNNYALEVHNCGSVNMTFGLARLLHIFAVVANSTLKQGGTEQPYEFLGFYS